MTYEFHPAVRLEFVEAVEFYESRQSGLGRAFSREILAAIEKIVETPHRWRLITPKLRQRFIQTYPCGIIYREARGRVLIVAIAHTSRRPGYWRGRSD